MAPEHVVGLLHDVAAACDIVGLAMTEYMPWGASARRKLLRTFLLLGG
jgi:arginase